MWNFLMKNNLINSNIVTEKKIDWQSIQDLMKDKFGNEIYESWLKKIELVDGSKLYFNFSRNKIYSRLITSRYLDQILQILKNLKDIVEFELVIDNKNENLKEQVKFYEGDEDSKISLLKILYNIIE